MVKKNHLPSPDWLFSRQRYWGEPIPIIHWEDGTSTAVPESELPLVLPVTKDIRPSGTGESPLANLTDWLEVTREDGVKGRRGNQHHATMGRFKLVLPSLYRPT